VLPAGLQEVSKAAGFSAHVACAEAARQRGKVQQDAAGSLKQYCDSAHPV
jgi:hypothetical protein